jgi:FkbM family methyltransferase
MDRPLLRLANAVYRATPFKPLRQLYFDTFAKLVRNRVVRTDVDGMQYELDLGEMIDLALYLRQFEPAVRDAIRRVTAPGMTVLDIGANIGAHTLLLASLVGPHGRVVAFEPMQYAFVKLRRNVAFNSATRIEIVRAALADENTRDQRMNFRSSWRPDGTRADGPSTVDLIRLDDWAAANGVQRVDVIKIDVDGAEFAAITGGLQTLARSRPTILMEAVGPHFDDDARNPYRLLASLGYTFRDIRGERELTLQALRSMLPRNDPGMTVSLNVVARPDDRPVAPRAGTA